MKKTRLSLILLGVLVSFVILVGTSAAQDIDVDAMSNEDLMVLLQSIMNKLEQNMAAEAGEKDPASADASGKSSGNVSSPAQETEPESESFAVYENKKLVIERLPDYLFIKKPNGRSSGGSDEGGSNDTITLEFHYGDYTFTIDIPEGSYGDYGIPTDVWTAW